MSAQPPDTRPALTEEQLQRLIQAVQQMRGGASVNVQDPRLSAVRNWVLGVVGTGSISVMTWLCVTVNELRITIASTAASSASQAAVTADMLRDHEQRLRVVERKP